MLCIPLVIHPVGWALLGLGGYALYKAGQRQGEKKAEVKMTAPVAVQDEQLCNKGDR